MLFLYNKVTNCEGQKGDQYQRANQSPSTCAVYLYSLNVYIAFALLFLLRHEEDLPLDSNTDHIVGGGHTVHSDVVDTECDKAEARRVSEGGGCDIE